MLKPILAVAALIALTAGATAGERRNDGRADAPVRYYGPVNNYYGPVTIYAVPDAGGYSVPPPVPGYSAATPPDWDANSYGAGYDWSHGYGNSYGDGGYAYPAYGYGYYGYPPSNEGQRQDPWAGYNGGFGNGYW